MQGVPGEFIVCASAMPFTPQSQGVAIAILQQIQSKIMARAPRDQGWRLRENHVALLPEHPPSIPTEKLRKNKELTGESLWYKKWFHPLRTSNVGGKR